jgi:hypothetical protein
MTSQPALPKYSNRMIRFGIVAVLCACPLLLMAQTAVSNWTLSNSNGTDSTGYSTYTFDNQVNTVNSITVGTSVKTISSSADSVYVRRSSGTDNNSNIWEVATSASNLTGSNTSAGTLQNVLLSNNALMGANDLFTNTGGTPAPVNNNIERVDYYFNNGFTAVPDQGFAIFDRAANHDAADGFQVAVITGWNTTTNTATSYGGNVVEVVAGATSKYGTALDYNPTVAGSQTTFTYQILRFTAGDSLATLNSADATNTQSIFGVYISFADLGIAQGTKVYGYSIMANDVTNVTANLVDWNNATYYPTNTPDTSGSIDLLAVNGKRWIPEPSTYGAMLLGICGAVAGVRRWRRQHGAVKAPAA